LDHGHVCRDLLAPPQVEQHAHLVLQWCYSGVTVVLQWCYSSVTVVSAGISSPLRRYSSMPTCKGRRFVYAMYLYFRSTPSTGTSDVKNRADSRQQTADSRQQTADSRQQTACITP
jgi:hypothetical protein